MTSTKIIWKNVSLKVCEFFAYMYLYYGWDPYINICISMVYLSICISEVHRVTIYILVDKLISLSELLQNEGCANY